MKIGFSYWWYSILFYDKQMDNRIPNQIWLKHLQQEIQYSEMQSEEQ